MAKCKCRYCQEGLLTQNAFKVTDKKKNAYFCNEEHYKLFLERVRQKETVENEEKAKRKSDKDKAYKLICEIIGRKEVINTILWKEWAIWNKVVSNETLGWYLEENKNYLISVVTKVEDNEFKRIRYLSAILKNRLGDYKPNIQEARIVQFPIIQEEHYETKFKPKTRKGLADLEEDCCE